MPPPMDDVLTPQNPVATFLIRISKAKLSVLNPLLRGRFTSVFHVFRNMDVDRILMPMLEHGILEADGQIHHLLLSQVQETDIFGMTHRLTTSHVALIGAVHM